VPIPEPTAAPTARSTQTAPAPTGPLSGLRVLHLGTVYAAPISATLLGDFGADVIKVEHPRGDPARTHGWNREGHGLWWKVIARNKRTITLNLSTPGDRTPSRKARP
jgi:crotonobetainyl-CoA:carnitine CoA-transferase CaiB-like acyl-CoA transferase